MERRERAMDFPNAPIFLLFALDGRRRRKNFCKCSCVRRGIIVFSPSLSFFLSLSSFLPLRPPRRRSTNNTQHLPPLPHSFFSLFGAGGTLPLLQSLPLCSTCCSGLPSSSSSSPLPSLSSPSPKNSFASPALFFSLFVGADSFPSLHTSSSPN